MKLDELLERLRSGAIEPVDVVGQTIPAHFHSEIDDVFLGVSGSGVVRTWDSAGRSTDHV